MKIQAASGFLEYFEDKWTAQITSVHLQSGAPATPETTTGAKLMIAGICGACKRHVTVQLAPLIERYRVGAKTPDIMERITCAAYGEMAEVAVPRASFADILRLIAGLRLPPDPAPA